MNRRVVATTLLLGVAPGLAGCGVGEALHRMDLDTFRQQCTEFGFAPGTTAFAQCMQKQSLARDQQDQDVVRRANQDNAKTN